MSKVLRGKDGQFAGSVGDGKTNVPAPQDAEFNAYVLHDVLLELASNDPMVRFDDLYAAYNAKITERETAAAAPVVETVPFKRGQWVRWRTETAVGFGVVIDTEYDTSVTVLHPDGSQSVCDTDELEALSSDAGNPVPSMLKPGVVVPATYESHRFLPVGTLVVVTDSTEQNGYWNNHYFVKTSDTTWARVNGNGMYQRMTNAEKAIQDNVNNVSPCPPPQDGMWVIVSLM